MRTRNAGNPKPTPPIRTPPTRKVTARTPPKSAGSGSQSATSKPTESKRAAAARTRQAKKNAALTATPISNSKPKQPSGEEVEASVDVTQATPSKKVATFTRSAARRAGGKIKTPTSISTTPESVKETDEEHKGEEELVVKDVEISKEEADVEDVGEHKEEEKIVVKDVEISKEEADVEAIGQHKEEEKIFVKDVEISKEEPVVEYVGDITEKEGIEESKEEDEKVEKAVEISKEEPAVENVGDVSEMEGVEEPKEEEEIVGKDVKISEEEPASENAVELAEKEGIEEAEVEKVIFVKDVEASKEEPDIENVGESADKEQTTMEVDQPCDEDVGESADKERTVMGVDQRCAKDIGEPSKEKESSLEVEITPIINIEKCPKAESSIDADVLQSWAKAESSGAEVEDETSKEVTNVEVQVETNVQSGDVEHNIKEELEGQQSNPVNEEDGRNKVGYDDKVDLGEHGDVELHDDDPAKETDAMEEEQRELSAQAKERKIRKAHEIFVGGLDRDALEEDVRKVFESIGEIVDVRLHKNPLNNKNKGYAFVKFANKEHAARALAEMKNPVIRGKRCGTVPSADNDTLFLGNICITWSKEVTEQKLKDYGVEGVESITLVADAQNEGLNRGFAFVEFSCHVYAMNAYKRLQQPDAIFGHPERTAKVAFAEPLRDPDPEIMAQVKSVFVDGVPPHWDDAHVRELCKGYGEIVRIVLARNMTTAKRKDFGFIDFSTHEAAIACIDGINNSEFGDGNSKGKVKARLSNPSPKTQAVKGGICGGFRIGHGGEKPLNNFGRGFGRGGQSFLRPQFTRGRGFHQGGRGQGGRSGFPINFEFNNPNPQFQGTQNIGRGESMGTFRGGHYDTGRGAAAATPSRPFLVRPWHNAPDRGYGLESSSRRPPYSTEGHFNRPFPGQHFDDLYLYNNNAHGRKRPFSMMDHDAELMEPGRLRQRFDYTDTTASFQGNNYRDAHGSGSSRFPHEHYGPDVRNNSQYRGGPYSSNHGTGPPNGGGYYY